VLVPVLGDEHRVKAQRSMNRWLLAG